METITQRYLNTVQAAKYLGLSKGKLYKLVEARRVPFIRIGTKSVRFDLRALDKWMEKQQIQAAPSAAYGVS